MKKEDLKLETILKGILIIILIIFLGIIWFKRNASDKPSEEQNTNYIYKIRYDLGTEKYIYLYENEEIKTIEITPIYEICEGTDCMNETGKYNQSEETINFSSDVKKEIIKVLDNLYKKSNEKEMNADLMDLTSYEKRVLLAVVTNDEDSLTIEKYFELEPIEEKIIDITNKKTIMKDDTNNKIINNIAKYLNKIIDEEFAKYNETAKELQENIKAEEGLGVNIDLKLEYVGPYSVSLSLTTSGQLGAVGMYQINSYVFDYNGNIKEIPGNIKNSSFQKALNKFKEDNLYLENKDKIYSNWENILKENLFKTGNYYLNEGKIIFNIDPNLIGIDDATSKNIAIEVEIDEDF